MFCLKYNCDQTNELSSDVRVGRVSYGEEKMSVTKKCAHLENFCKIVALCEKILYGEGCGIDSVGGPEPIVKVSS